MIALSLGLLMLIAGGVLAIVGLAKGWRTKGLKAIMTLVTIGMLGLPILGYFQLAPFNDLVQPFGTGQPITVPSMPTTPTPLPSTDECLRVEKTAVTLSGVDGFTGDATGGTHRYRINGGPAKTLSDAGSFNADPGNIIDILWMNASVSSYISDVSKETVPCEGTKTFSQKLYKNGTLTTQVFNEEGDLIGTNSGTNQSLAANQQKSLKMTVYGEFQKAFPHGFTVIAEYNKSYYDKVQIRDDAGKELPTAVVPIKYTSTLTKNSATKAWTFPAVIQDVEWNGKLFIDTSSTAIVAGSSQQAGINLSWWPNNYYVDNDEGGAYKGPAAEDEDHVATRGGSADPAGTGEDYYTTVLVR